MTRYTKTKLIRFKQLNTFNWELILSRGDMKVKPGDALNIYRPDIGAQPYLIASGSQEAWIRLIITANDSWVHWLKTIKPNDLIRIMPNIVHKIPDMTELSSDDVYICSEHGIAPYLSYISTFINDDFTPVLIYHYNMKGINIETIDARRDTFHGSDLKLLLNKVPDYGGRYYITATPDQVKTITRAIPQGSPVIVTPI